ncbi:type I 3-dehydroquinate dehydratase, partial [Listeria monocytogenes]|nr:type I 3-dehydroquinate dehydratase [Listeria monocytogenes]
GKIDLVDVELFNEEADVLRLIETAHKNNVKVVMSNHDFDKTPAKEEIVSRLTRMEALGADLPKIAVMPKSAGDVLTLLDATNTVSEKANQPIITMSMAGTGVISRLAGEVFGSAMTFGAAKKASAPGQIDVNELRHVLDLLHKQF